jgi:Tfp pilus assembly protein PilF
MKNATCGGPFVLALALLAPSGCVLDWDGTALPDLGQHELPPKKAAQVCLAVAELEEKEGREADAIAQYQKARQFDPSLRSVGRRLAVLYDRTGDADHALAEYRRAIDDNPRDGDLHNDLGYFYYQRGAWAEAERTFRAALALRPDYARAWNNLGMTLAQQQRYEESLAAFQKVVSPANAYCNLGFILMTQGKHAEAKQAYEKALQKDPSLKVAQDALASLQESPALARTTK